MPTTVIPAPSVSTVAAAEARTLKVSRDARAKGGSSTPGLDGPMAMAGPYIGPINHSGQPALSIPCGFTSSGLPIGLMIVGKRFMESTILGIGYAYQQATDWHTRVPVQ